jgi:hypothetical protein
MIRTATSASVLGLAAIFMAPSASAAIITGSWDPPMVSPPFDGLGWATTINFSVPADCLGDTGIINVRFLNRSFRCGSATPAITVLRAQIGLYDLTTDIYKYAITLDPATLLPQILSITSEGVITYLFSLLPSASVKQRIKGEDLSDIPGPTGSPAVPAADTDYWFRLAMPGGAPILQYSDTGRFSDFEPATAPGFAPVLTSFRNDAEWTTRVQDDTEIRVGRSVNQVPEPQSLALVLLAVAAAGAATRHRSRRTTSGI